MSERVIECVYVCMYVCMYVCTSVYVREQLMSLGGML